MKILVTGGAGYIGSHLVLSLCDQGYEVSVLDNLSSGSEEAVDKRALLINGSTLNIDDIKKGLEGADCVIHLAAFKAAGESMINPGKYSTNNIIGTINVLNTMLDMHISNFIFSSTAAVYGNPEYLPIDEKHPLKPINYYGFTKLQVENILKWYSKTKGLNYASLRYFNAAGYQRSGKIITPEKKPANLIPLVVEVAAGKRKSFDVFGDDYETFDGTGVRDYIHVEDLASAHLKAIQYLKNNDSLIVNLGSGNRFSVKDVIKMCEEVTGRGINYNISKRREGDPGELYASSSLALSSLKWEAEFSDLKTIIETTWHIYQ